MNVQYGKISFSRPGVQAPENKFLGSRNIEQGEIFRWRTNENQVVVLGIVQREQGSALDPDRTIEERENMVQFVNGQHLSHAGVVVEDESAPVGGWIEVAHPSFGPSNKAAVAEDY